MKLRKYPLKKQLKNKTQGHPHGCPSFLRIKYHKIPFDILADSSIEMGTKLV